nr:EOG090X0CGF [Macrothrix elegans]
MFRGILRLGASVTPKASYATFDNKNVFRSDSGLISSQPRTPTVSGAELELRQYVESARDLTKIDSFRQTLLKQHKSQQLNDNTFDAVFMRGCLAYRNYSLGKAYLKHIESQGRKINTATLSKFLALCYFCQDQVENRAEVEEWCRLLQSHSEYLDKDSKVNLVLALSTTDKWQETVKMLNEDEEINVTLVLNAIVERYLSCDNFVDSLFWMEKLVSKELAVSESVYSHWIQKSATNHQAWDLFMNFLSQNTIYLKQPLIDRLKEMVETRDQDAFQGQLTVVDRFTSKCRSCGKPMENIAISEEDFALLKEGVMKNIVHNGDVFIGSVPEELERFRSFIQKTAPYDVVIDGLNVAFQSPGKYSNSSDKKMEGVLPPLLNQSNNNLTNNSVIFLGAVSSKTFFQDREEDTCSYKKARFELFAKTGQRAEKSIACLHNRKPVII